MAKAKNKAPLENEIEEVISTPSGFLSDDVRADIIQQLKDANVATEGLDDLGLVAAIAKSNADMTAKQLDPKALNLEQKLNYYARKSTLHNREFITRLFFLNVPDIYLKIFDDHNSNLTDDQIWRKINKSKIKPIKEFSEIVKPRYKLKDNINEIDDDF